MKTDPGPRVLVVDDEENITFLLESALRHFGFDVRVARSGRDALREVERFAPSVMLLDVMLPDLEGFEILRRVRMDGNKVPVLFLTGRDSVQDEVKGLTLGGDDYVAKPFSLEEVIARVEALLRRTGVAAATSMLQLADLEMDDDAHVVRRGDEVIDLSPMEYSLLRFLLVNKNRVLSRDQILDHVWQYDFGGQGNAVAVYISYLRKKIDSLGPPLIHTVRGVRSATLRTTRRRGLRGDLRVGDVDDRYASRPNADGALQWNRRAPGRRWRAHEASRADEGDPATTGHDQDSLLSSHGVLLKIRTLRPGATQ